MSYDLAINRVYRDWFRDPTYGLNAQLALLASDGLLLAGDTAPAALADAAIADEADPSVADSGFPEVGEGASALGIQRYQPHQMPGELFTLAGLRDIEDFPTLVAYRLETSDAGLAYRTWSYVGRALIRSLRLLFRQEHEAARKLAQVGVTGLPAIDHLPRFQLAEGKVATGGFVLHSAARDLKP